jgi:thiamine kinase-like enzyme
MIPKVEEDITSEYLTKVLNFGEIVEIKKKETTTQGYSSKSQIIELIYKDENNQNPKEIFIKHAKPEKTTVYPYLYNTELKWLKLNCAIAPKLFFSDFEEGYYVVITESLKGRFGLQKNHSSIDDIKFILKKWAEFQKGYIHQIKDINEFKKEKKIDLPNIVDLSIHFFDDIKEYPKITEELIKDHLKVVKERWENTYKTLKGVNYFENKDFFNDLEKFNKLNLEEIYPNAYEESLNSIQSIIHNDFRTDHFCFLENDKLMLLDWQGVCFGNPLVDIAKVMCESIKHEDLKKNFDELLDIYQTNFCPDEVDLGKVKKLFKSSILINLERLFYLISLFGSKFIDSNDVSLILLNSMTNSFWSFFNL